MSKQTVRVRITGQVQGVWYRNWTINQAKERQLSGWVRNRRDGSVEAVFSGDSEDVQAMVAACHDGPRQAQVLDVSLTPEPNLPAPGFVEAATV